MDQQTLLNAVIALAQQAGKAVRNVYEHQVTQVTHKSDGSPLTQADLAAQRIIAEGLRQLTPTIPLISEEIPLPDWQIRRSWPQYWLVDPLDGTKEFVARTDEFTVNIALIQHNQPILGVVDAPMLGITYATAHQLPAWRITAKGKTTIHVRSPQAPLVLLASRRHKGGRVDRFSRILEQNTNRIVRQDVGSSLKMCRIAEGSADIYPRFGPTCEWDTAAADAILRNAGGELVKTNMQPLEYNKQAIVNPDFFAIAKHNNWQQLPQWIKASKQPQAD